MSVIDSRIEDLKKEIKELEKKKKQGPLTFEEWANSLAGRYALKSDPTIVPIAYYSGKQIKGWEGYCSHYRRLVIDVRGFFEGHRPILMLGSYTHMTRGRDYASVQNYVSKVLSRYICSVLKPTVFTVQNWRELWSKLSYRYQERHRSFPDREGIRPVRYMGRREPYFLPTGGCPVGLDQAPYDCSFMIKGKFFSTFKNDICDFDAAQRISKDRADILLQFAKQHDKLEKLSAKLEKL